MCAFARRAQGTVRPARGYWREITRAKTTATMYGFGTNFIAGLLLGAALTIIAPLAATDLTAGVVMQRPAVVQSSYAVQTVNRAAKSNRLHNPMRATRDIENEKQNNKPAKIPIGCDAAFSPLSKGARMNFSSRCLAENNVGNDRGIITVALAAR
jgi:hypothetical protein